MISDDVAHKLCDLIPAKTFKRLATPGEIIEVQTTGRQVGPNNENADLRNFT